MPDDSDDSVETPYKENFRRQTQKRIDERRAQNAADAAVEWVSYPQAVHFVRPVLFAKDWVGPPSEQEQVVLKLGQAHPDWNRYSLRQREREEQIERAERWLLIHDLVEERRGHRLVQAERLRKALADDGYVRDRIADRMTEEADERAPDWRIWSNLLVAKLYECVALSLNIDPRKLRHNPLAWMTGGPGRRPVHVFDEGQAFKDRLFLADRSLGNALWLVNWNQYTRGADPVVKLAAFARWARSSGWEMPVELLQLTGDPRQSPPSATTEPAQATTAAQSGATATGSTAAAALWEAELRKPWSERQYFHIAAITLRLSRKPGRLETDEEEAHRILLHLIASSDRGEFADDELVVLVEEAPHIVPAMARLAQEYGSAIPLLIWRDAVLATRRAVERFLRGCDLAGAPRLLAEWGFADEPAEAKQPEPTPTAAALKVAVDGRIHRAITAAYDAADAAGEKPPNVNEIIEPVQALLRSDGYEAAGKKIRELAGNRQHARRRWKPGTTKAAQKRKAPH